MPAKPKSEPTNGVTNHAPPPPALSPAAEELKREANAYFESEQYSQAVDLYNLALIKHHHPILLANRAAALMRRAWDGDVYAALRYTFLEFILMK